MTRATSMQQVLLEYYKAYKDRKPSPTYAEIGKAVIPNMSVPSVHDYVKELIGLGHLETMGKGSARGVSITDLGRKVIEGGLE